MPLRRKSHPLNGVYLITFSCYGCHLPGDNAIVGREHNAFRVPYTEIDEGRHVRARLSLRDPRYSMDQHRRMVVLQAIRRTCEYRRWRLMAAHIRATHVHAFVDSPATPEAVMNALKAYASRALNDAGLDSADQKRWARHGSTRYLWNHEQISAAIIRVGSAG